LDRFWQTIFYKLALHFVGQFPLSRIGTEKIFYKIKHFRFDTFSLKHSIDNGFGGQATSDNQIDKEPKLAQAGNMGFALVGLKNKSLSLVFQLGFLLLLG